MIKWPWHILTNEGEAKILLREALAKAPSLRADGLTDEGPSPDLELIAVCNDFLMSVRMRETIDDQVTAAERSQSITEWAATHVANTDGIHGAFIAAALGRGANYLQCGISCYLNLRSHDFEDRLVSMSRHIRR